MAKIFKPVNNIYNKIIILVLIINFCLGIVFCDYPVISDKSIITISLRNYNVTDKNGSSIDDMYTIKPNSSCQIDVTSVPKNVNFVIVQVHSFFKDITLSYDSIPSRETSVTGINIGLLKMNTSPVLSYSLIYKSSNDSVSVMISVQAYGQDAPIPGGCNMEFQVETSPFLKLNVDAAVTEVDFAPAAPPSNIFSNFIISSDDVCNIKPNQLSYTMYRLYLPERDFSEELYFSSLKMMMTQGRILENGRSVPDKYGGSLMRHVFASYPGIGSVFVVIVKSNDGSSVYVPSFTYSCSLEDPDDCKVLTTTFSKLLCATIFFLGLFACFAAHRFFKIELFLLGFVSGTLVGYIAALNLESDEPWTLSVGIGIICGAVFIVTWCFRGLPLFSLVIATTVLGYLVASSILYTLVDYFDAFESDINYWALFGSIMLLGPILMLSLSEKANVIACSIVGAYTVILAVDYYIGSTIRYIVINSIRRATIPKFKHAIIDPPYQTKDILLTSLWIIMALAGTAVQLFLIRGRPPYPPPSYPFRRTARSCMVPSERTPLLRATT